MANSIVNSELWSGQFIDRLQPLLVGMNFCDTSLQPVNNADRVITLTANAVASGTYTKGTNFVLADAGSTKESLVLDQTPYWAFALDDIERAQSDAGTVGKLMQNAAYSMADSIDKYIFTLHASAATANKMTAASSAAYKLTGESPTGNLYELLVDAGVKLTKAGAPQSGRWVVLSPEVYAMALKDTTRFIRASALGDRVVTTSRFFGEGVGMDTAATTPGFVGQIAGLDVYVSPNLTTASSGANVYLLFGQGQPIHHSSVIGDVKVAEIDLQFGSVIKQLVVHGGKVFGENAKRLGSIYVVNS